jgi:hypothetical protein
MLFLTKCPKYRSRRIVGLGEGLAAAAGFHTRRNVSYRKKIRNLPATGEWLDIKEADDNNSTHTLVLVIHPLLAQAGQVLRRDRE